MSIITSTAAKLVGKAFALKTEQDLQMFDDLWEVYQVGHHFEKTHEKALEDARKAAAADASAKAKAFSLAQKQQRVGELATLIEIRQLERDKLRIERTTGLLENAFWGGLAAAEVGTVILLLYLASGRLSGAPLTVGTLVLFAEYTRRVFWPLAVFSEQLGFIQRAFAAADRVFELAFGDGIEGFMDDPCGDRCHTHKRIAADGRAGCLFKHQ